MGKNRRVKDGQLSCVLIASLQFLVAVRAGLQVPFVCSEANELGERLVGSYLHQVHLRHWLESNNYDRSCQTPIYIYKG